MQLNISLSVLSRRVVALKIDKNVELSNCILASDETRQCVKRGKKRGLTEYCTGTRIITSRKKKAFQTTE